MMSRFWLIISFCKSFPPTGEFVEVGGIRLHYVRKGNGKPVVFLHGGILSANDFDSVLDLAAAKGYSAIAFDRPGNGYSERPRGEIATPVVQARFVHDALCELGIHRPIIAGHSWSGSLVMSYALHYADERLSARQRTNLRMRIETFAFPL